MSQPSPRKIKAKTNSHCIRSRSSATTRHKPNQRDQEKNTAGCNKCKAGPPPAGRSSNLAFMANVGSVTTL
jgi:hypothetical protein